MYGLRDRLLEEQRRMETILKKVQERLKNAPDGKLRISKCKKWVQYYYNTTSGKKGGSYISKDKGDMISRLAQKDYDEKVMKLAQRRLSQLRRLTGDYDDKEVEKIFLNEHIERQKLICPVEPTWDMRLKEWLSCDYKGKEFRDDTVVILTDRGERVRSKSEKILADWFYRHGIPYKYECPLNLKGFGRVYPDFTFLSPKTKEEVYWEHDGRMDDPIYVQSAVKKIQAYMENDIYPGERLILTFETEKTLLDTRIIEKLATKYLL